MPFKSLSQMYVCVGYGSGNWRWNCKEWLDHTKNIYSLPYKVKYSRPASKKSIDKMVKKIRDNYPKYKPSIKKIATKSKNNNPKYTKEEKHIIHKYTMLKGYDCEGYFRVKVSNIAKKVLCSNLVGNYILFKIRLDTQNRKYVIINKKKYFVIKKK